jgi:beta-glucanase (GH16 family)
MNKTTLLVILFTALNWTAHSNAADSSEKKLVWSDEFDGKDLDYTKWGIEVNAFGGGNNEMQIYTDRAKNIRVENGNLIIEAHKDNAAIAGTSRPFSSGRIRTRKRGDWKYGRIDVRAKLPVGKGIWPAIWMLPTDEAYGGWASSGEIDIMELVGHEPNTYHGTLHYGDSWPKNKHSGKPYKLSAGSFADEFHVYSIDWKEGEISWYLNGKLWQTQNKWSSAKGKFPAPFDKRFHLILNLAVGGNWPGPPNKDTQFPARLVVDYIRVYQHLK